MRTRFLGGLRILKSEEKGVRLKRAYRLTKPPPSPKFLNEILGLGINENERSKKRRGMLAKSRQKLARPPTLV